MAAVGWRSRARDLIDLTLHRTDLPAVEPLDVIDLRSVADEPQAVATRRYTGVIGGGGAIASPVGAYVRVPSAGGEATFGFVCTRLADDVSPSGFTALTLERTDLDFRSAAYDWLVIAGSTAQAVGSGSVNGVEGYSFEATAVDGGPAGSSTFRLKIWLSATGAVLYDSAPRARGVASPITRGAITVMPV